MKFMLGYLTDSVFKTWGYDERLCINLIHKEYSITIEEKKTSVVQKSRNKVTEMTIKGQNVCDLANKGQWPT